MFQYWRRMNFFLYLHHTYLNTNYLDEKLTFSQRFQTPFAKQPLTLKFHKTVKADLQRLLAWFVIDYFQHILDLIARARRKFLITK